MSDDDIMSRSKFFFSLKKSLRILNFTKLSLTVMTLWPACLVKRFS